MTTPEHYPRILYGRLPVYPKKPHKTGQARIKWQGKTYYLGRHGTPESYQRFVEVVASITGEPPAKIDIKPVVRTGIKYMFQLADEWNSAYRQKRASVGQLRKVHATAKWIIDCLGELAIEDTRSAHLARMFQKMVASDLASSTMRSYRTLFKDMLEWGALHGWVSDEQASRLKSVKLESVIREAKEDIDRAPVSDRDFQLTLEHLSEPYHTIATLQRSCGARPSEIQKIRVEEIEWGDGTCLFIPQQHKTAKKKKFRVFPIPAEQQAIVRQLCEGKSSGSYLFPKPSHRINYNYQRAVERAVRDANQEKPAPKPPVSYWTPYQLRHSAADEIHRLLGKEEAKLILGHSNLQTTEIYLTTQKTQVIEACRQLEAARALAEKNPGQSPSGELES